MTTNETIQGLIQTNKGPVKIAGGAGIHIGTEAPTNGETVWIDTDEEPEEENDGAQIDVIAQPGQIIAVKEIDANGKPTKWEAIDLPKAKDPETPDFSANEGDAGYIKNRTHYVDKKGVIHKLPNMYIDAEWMATKEDGGAGKTVFIPEQTVADGMWTNLQGTLTESVVYAVEVNGILYRCECRNYNGTLYLGNGTLLGGTEHNGEPFCITWMGGTAKRGQFYTDGTLDAPIGIKVREWIDDIYNKLPEAFLPPMSWNNLTDRPVVDGAGEAFLTYTTTFATDTAAKNGAKLPNSLTNTLLWLDVNGELVKVQRQQSGMVMEWYDEDGNKWVSSSLGGVYVYAQTAGTYTYTMYAPADTPMFDPQYLPPNLAKKADIPTGGGSGGTSIDVTAEVGQTIVVKEIDANGKPTKWESADYPVETVEIVPQTTFTGNFDSNYGCFMYSWVGESLVVGMTYTVIFDGVKYVRTAKAASINGMIGVYVGNEVLLGNNTGEPFCLISVSGAVSGVYALLFDAGEHTARSTYNRIKSGYLGNDASPYYIEVTGGGTTDNPYVCNDTTANVRAIYESGRELKVVKGDTISKSYLPLVMVLKSNNRMMFGFLALSPYFSTPVDNNAAVLRFWLAEQDDGTFAVSTGGISD